MTQAAQQAWIERVRSALEGEGRRPLIEYLQRQRWFGGKGKPLADAHLSDTIELSAGAAPRLLAVLLVKYRGGDQERYMMPLVIRPKPERVDASAIVEMPGSSAHEWVCDGTRDEEIWKLLYERVAQGKELAGESGCMVSRTIPGSMKELAGPVKAVKVLSGEQSNTSVVFDRRVIMKLIRKVEMGINPDSEVLEFLARKTLCRDVPPLLGLMTYDEPQAEEGIPGTVVVVQRFIPNIGDGWSYTLARLNELLEQGRGAVRDRGDNLSKAVGDISGAFLGEIHHLGAITGNLHLALSSKTEQEAFRPEPITEADVARWHTKMLHFLAEVCRELRALSADQRSAVGLAVDDMDRLEAACRYRFGDIRLLTKGKPAKTRHHGDYHLGQVLKTDDGFVVIDFEGEPARPLEERRAKVCPLKDVAGMLRSFNYAAQAALKQHQPVSIMDAAVMAEWERAGRAAFLDGYRSVARSGQAVFLPASWDHALRVLQVYELDKALYELRYEMRNRPDWLSLPLQGIRSLTQEHAA